MDRMTKAVINGTERNLNYSVAVMFDMTDKFGNIRAALETIAEESKEGFDALRWFAVAMANDGELCRRELGYDPRPMMEESDLSMRTMSPLEYASLQGAVVEAINRGYLREVTDGEEQEIDLGLEELQAKKVEAGE